VFKHIDDNFDARYNEKNEIEKHHSAHNLADKNAREGRLDPDDHVYRDIYHRNLESYHHDRKVLHDAGQPDNNPNTLGVRQIRKTRLFSPQRAASIDLGDGNDNGIGFEQKRNIFIGRQGKKHYTGGQLEDIFYLGRPQAPISTVPDASLASFFDGAGSDQDMLIIDASYEGVSGYLVDLQQGEVYYREEEKPDRLAAKIANIEHVSGHLTGDDIFEGGIGNDSYLYRWGDGYDQITDSGGEDRLKVFEMSEEAIQLRGTASRLILNFTNAKGGILFSDQVEQIDVNGALFDTARLVEAMSHFGTQGETSPINLTSLISVVGRQNLLSTGVVE